MRFIFVRHGETEWNIQGRYQGQADIPLSEKGKAQAAVKGLLEQGYDFAYIHVEAPDEMGHQGSVEDKITAIENIDGKVVRTVVEGLRDAGEDFRILILPDHPTPIEVRTHTKDAVPYLLYDSTADLGGKAVRYDEKTGQESGILVEKGHMLIRHLFENGEK